MYDGALLLEKQEQTMGVGKWRHIMSSEISERLGKEMKIKGEMRAWFGCVWQEADSDVFR